MRLISYLAILFLLFIPATSYAIPPAPGYGHVFDYADVLTSAAETELEEKLRDVKIQTTAEFAIVTVTSLEGMTVEDYANRLFNDWGIGLEDVNNGVLLLVAPNDRRTRIEVGYGLESLITDSLASDIINDTLLPRFKKSQFEEGIREGADFIVNLFYQYPEAAAGKRGSGPWYVGSEKRNARLSAYIAVGSVVIFLVVIGVGIWREQFTLFGFWVPSVVMLLLGAFSLFRVVSAETSYLTWIPGFGTIGAYLFGFSKYLRYGPRRCRKCGSKQVRLNDAKEDEHLSETEMLEEEIGSIDYDVWLCSACLATHTESYVKYLSGFSDCPKCGVRARKETSDVVLEATKQAEGKRKYTSHCIHCDDRNVWHETIPVKTESSSSSSGGFSSSGGGFGGGSSGGGGASGGW